MIGREDLIEYVARVQERTRDVVSAIPPELVAWRPAPGEFSLAEIAVHMANMRHWNAERATGDSDARYRGHDAHSYQTLDALLALMDESSRESLELIGGADLQREIPSTMGPIEAWRRVLGGLIEHEIHHRSQLASLLSQKGVQPPALYGIFVEELPGNPN